MSADFWAGYLSGAAGIIIGNPLDLIKTRLQAGPATSPPPTSPTSLAATPLQSPTAPRPSPWSSLLRGSAFPILGYGALNALLFMTYNRSMLLLNEPLPSNPTSLTSTFAAGTAAGLATFVVSAPTELVKCRVQVLSAESGIGSWTAAREVLRGDGVRGLYWGGGVTALRDGVGYGFYYWSYELSKRALMRSRGSGDATGPEWMSVLLCGGIAGVVTWASIFPLDVIKTRVQTQGLSGSMNHAATPASEVTSLLRRPSNRLGAVAMAGKVYREEGIRPFFRGLGVCSARAFVVNAVQWAVYEWIMHVLIPSDIQPM